MNTNARTDLAALIEHGKRAMARNVHENAAGDIVADSNRAMLAGVNGALSLRAMLSELIDGEGNVYRTPAATPANDTRTIAGLVMENSAVVRAGAKLIEMREPAFEGAPAGEPLFAQRPTRFNLIEPAQFQPVTLTDATDNQVNDASTATSDDEGSVSTSALPVASASIDFAATTQRAFRTRLTRGDLNDREAGELAAEVSMAIAYGLGRAVDAELLTAIVAASPLAFTPAAAAESGARWSELRALVGTGGAGVDLSMTPVEAGALHVQGVPGDLTDQVSETVIGAFDRFAVAVQPSVDLLMERGADGSLTMTAWADFYALLPDAGMAWVVA